MSAAVEYRVSWEMPPPTVCAYDYEDIYGPGIWKRLTPWQWEALPWKPSENITTDHDEAHDQYTQLKQWADNHSQPIRNVKIERRDPAAWVEVADG